MNVDLYNIPVLEGWILTDNGETNTLFATFLATPLKTWPDKRPRLAMNPYPLSQATFPCTHLCKMHLADASASIKSRKLVTVPSQTIGFDYVST